VSVRINEVQLLNVEPVTTQMGDRLRKDCRIYHEMRRFEVGTDWTDGQMDRSTA